MSTPFPEVLTYIECFVVKQYICSYKLITKGMTTNYINLSMCVCGYICMTMVKTVIFVIFD